MPTALPSHPFEKFPELPAHNGGWTAIVLAGRRPGADPLAAHFGVESKALVSVDGEAMLSRVVRTLSEAPQIGRIILLAQDTDTLIADTAMAWARHDPRIIPAPSGEGIASSILAAIESGITRWPILVTTADNVLLTPEIIAHFLGEAEECDLTVGLVSRATLLAAYPDSRRTWLRFRCGAYTGANLFALRSTASFRALDLWRSAERDRKSLLRVAAHFGPLPLLRIALRTLTLREAIARAGLRLDLRAQPVVLPFAEAGIDVDKPVDHVLVEGILECRRTAAQ